MHAPEIIEHLKGGERVQFPAEWLDVFFAEASQIKGQTRLDVLIDNGQVTLGALPVSVQSVSSIEMNRMNLNMATETTFIDPQQGAELVPKLVAASLAQGRSADFHVVTPDQSAIVLCGKCGTQHAPGQNTLCDD